MPPLNRNHYYVKILLRDFIRYKYCKGGLSVRARILLIALSAAALTSCGTSVHGDYREEFRETESVTDSLTEPEPEPEPQEFYFEEETDMAVFLPILRREKRDTELEDRLRPYMKKIILAESLRGYAMMNNYYGEEIFDFGNLGEHEFYSDSLKTYTKIRDEFGGTKAQLLNFFGTVCTDDYINSICENTPLEEELFGDSDNGPLFEERENGVYRRVVMGEKGMIGYDFTDFDVRFFDGKTAEIGIPYDHDYGCGYEIFFLKHDEGRGWRLDSKGKNYWVRTHAPPHMEDDTRRFEIIKLDMRAGHTAGVDFVFKYFNETSEDDFIEQDGEKYFRVKNNFPIDDLRKIFSEHIDEYKWEWDSEAEDFVRTDELLLQPCLDKYINEVFIESEGILYRREGAPVYEIDHPDYNGRDAVSAQVSTPALGDDMMSVFICGNGEKAMFLSGGRLVTDIPLREAD